MFSKLKAELDAVMERDPAARSRAEVYFLYAGFKAVRAYRRANWFYAHWLCLPIPMPTVIFLAAG